MASMPANDADPAGELQLAISRAQLSLLYQPKIDLRSGNMAGVEALVRWTREGEELGPSEFVPIAERCGLIDELTEFVMKTALRQWVSWHEQGITTNIAVNISALSLRDTYLPDYLHRLCMKEGVPPSCVTIEVTEGATQNVLRLLDTLSRIRLKGMSLALDDFGTGYSSMLQLRQLPYTELKIDQCFVRDMASSNEARLIVQAMINLAHGFGLTSTAEGVEDRETLMLLQELGCDHAQGFLLTRPIEGGALAEWLLKEARQWREACYGRGAAGAPLYHGIAAA